MESQHFSMYLGRNKHYMAKFEGQTDESWFLDQARSGLNDEDTLYDAAGGGNDYVNK